MRSFRSWTTAGPAGLVVVLLFLPARPAAAHPMPHSIVALDVHTSGMTADIRIPVKDLTYASGVDLTTDDAPAVLAAHQQELREYLAGHVRPVTDGAPWKASLSTVTLSEAEQTGSGAYREIIARATFRPPDGVSTRRFDLYADPVIHQVVTHTVLVTAVRDGQGGAHEIGTVRTDTATMTVSPLHVDLEKDSWWPTFGDMFSLGLDRVREGAGHFLFLPMLLLAAPVSGSRPAGVRTMSARISWITLAFGVGQSVTLAIGTLTRAGIPARPVEVLIALGVLAGAAHAARPLFPGREALVAGGFGLVHGLAFSSVLTATGPAPGDTALGPLGFGLGIVAAELTAVALMLPALIVLNRSPRYRPVRLTGALVISAAAVGLLLDRLGRPGRVAETASLPGTHDWWFVAGSALAALLVLVPLAVAVPVSGTRRRQIVLPESTPEPDRSDVPG